MAVINIQYTKIEIQIAKYVFKHYKDMFNARQLAKLLQINHAHANKLCNLMTKKNLMLKKEIGNSFYYIFNYDDKLAIKFIEYILSLEEFPKWHHVLLHSLDKFKPYCEIILLFGSSITRKDFNDIDIMLLYDSKQTNQIKRIKEEIRKSNLIEKPIRYVELSEKDIMPNNEDKIFYNIMSDNLVFHNPEKYAEIITKCHKSTTI